MPPATSPAVVCYLARLLDHARREARLRARRHDQRVHAGPVVRGKHDPRFIRQLGQRDAAAPREPVAVGQRGHHPVAQQRLDMHVAGIGHRQHDDADVRAVLTQREHLFGGRAFLELEIDVRMALLERAQDQRQQRVDRAVDEAQPQRAAEAGARAARHGHRALGLFERAPRFEQERFAGRREPRAAVVALEQCDAQFVLELADRRAERRLSHVQSLGRAPEAERFGDRDELPELAQIDHAIPAMYQ